MSAAIAADLAYELALLPEGADIEEPEFPSWRAMTAAILDGQKVNREMLLRNIGLHFAGHPIYLVSFYYSKDCKTLAPEYSGGQGSGISYEAKRTGVTFYTMGWEPMGEKDRPLHSVNGCCNCPKPESEQTADERAKRTGTCPDPMVFRTEENLLVVRWTEVGRFVWPALIPERIDVMSEYLARRNALIQERDDGAYPVSITDQQTLDEVAEARLAYSRRWSAIEDEGRRIATEVWDVAYRRAVRERLGVRF